MKILFLLFALTTGMEAHAALSFELNPQDVEKIQVIGLESQVQLIGQPTAQKLRINGIDETSEPGNFVFEKKDRILTIKMQEYGDRKEWKEVLQKPIKKHVIELVGAPVPVEIQLREGYVSAQKWNKEVKASLVKGKFTSVGGSAALTVQLQTGEILVQDQASKVIADLYKGNTVIRSLNGDLEASVFNGTLNIEKTKGFMQVQTAQSTAKILQSSGTLQFENVKGVLIAQQFAGRVDGQTGEGNVNVSILPETDVQIKSQSGRVTVQTTPNSGVSVNLVSAEGEITVPNELRVNKTATEKTVRGRLKGGEQRGSVVVRSQEGSIVVK